MAGHDIDPGTSSYSAAHHHRTRPPLPAEAIPDILTRARGGGGAATLFLVCAVLAVIGAVALVLMVLQGPEPRGKWGYIAATTAFILSTAQAAPVLAFATRLAKGFWAIPVRRAAELWGVSSLVTLPLLAVLLFQLPDWKGRPSIWFDWPWAPQAYDLAMFVGFTVLALAIIYFTTRPDRITVEDLASRGALRARSGWIGAHRQWLHLSGSIVMLGAMYLMMHAYVHIYVVSDLAMSLIPHFHSAIYPAYHGVSGLQGAIATTILTLGALRRWGGLERYIGLDQFWGAAKLLLATSLLFFYFTWNEFIIYWYGRQPSEIALLGLMMFQTARALFIVSFACNFILPWLLLIWNPLRVSIKGPQVVAAIVIFGNLVDRLRIYGTAWDPNYKVGDHLDVTHLPTLHFPGILEILVCVGAIAAVLALYVLALRRFPVISLWEYRFGWLLMIERPLHRLRAIAIAKPN